MTELTYQIPDTVVADTKAFRLDVEKYISGEISAVAFRAIRVPMGIYEQRVNDTYMVRVRGAAGVFLPHQIKLIADLSRKYGNGTIHVTTRQDLQIHCVRIEDTPTILEKMLDVGLSTRGGGGNTVRNISACPTSGACGDEIFNVTPYALALTEYLIRERGNFNLPRKFKVAFSGCSKDCGLASVADLGFFAHERDGIPGFAVYAAGGMGSHSALGVPIEDFVPTEAIFEIAEAVKRLFDKNGDRTNRSKARLRFVVERMGVDEFRRAYREELQLVQQEQIEFPALLEQNNVSGISSLKVHLPLGDISAKKLSALADVASKLDDGTIRTTQQQNLQLRATGSETDNITIAIQEIDKRFTETSSVECVACAGAATCKLGLCLSRGLATAIEMELRNVTLPFEADIRISGCPNSCGHHPIASIGFYGSASRVDGKLVPIYKILAGGKLVEGKSAFGQPVGKVPAKAVPGLVKEFFAAAVANVQHEETLHDLMNRWGIDYLRELAKHYESVPAYEEAPEYYRDFGCCTDFSLAGRGPGECGAGVTDVIALDIDEAKRAVKENRLYDAILAAARALLITKDLEPKKDREVLEAFSKHLIAPGWVLHETQSLLDAALDFRLGDQESLDDKKSSVESLVDRVEKLFLSLDSNLSFRIDPLEKPEANIRDNEITATEIDLRGVACPMNFVRAKIQLEDIEIGQVLEILLDDGEPVRNVPASFTEQGQEVISIIHENGHHRVSVRRCL